MKYINIFENHAAYEAAEINLALPNVALCAQEHEVYYKPLSDPSMGHEYITIGGVKWATMNIGANSVTDFGLYFQWGDTQGYTADQLGSGEGKKYFGWKDYKYGNGTSSPGNTGMTKYQGTGEGKDGLTALQISDDGVAAAWGGNWRMPTKDEFIALGNAVNTAWTQVNGVYGLQCTDKTDSSKVLFFPAAGMLNDGDEYSNDCHYWSSSLFSDVSSAYYFYYGYENSSLNWQDYAFRRCGFPLRGVLGA